MLDTLTRGTKVKTVETTVTPLGAEILSGTVGIIDGPPIPTSAYYLVHFDPQ